MKVLITGAGGLVGRAMIKRCTDAGDQTVGLDHARLDIGDRHAVDETFDRERADVVINCAAWTDVDACEADPERARTVNAHGPEFLALACQRLGSLFVTISTDYVFDGEKNGFYTQRDQPNPQSAYARSKLEGEHLAQIAWARTIVVRSGYIFGVGGRNFLSSVIDQVRRGKRVRALNDTFGTPTYAPDLASQLYQLARLDLPGIYHVVNAGGGTSFEAFVRRAVEIARLDTDLVEGISRDTLKRAAPRPRNSRLRCLLSEAIGLAQLPSFEDALHRFVVAGSPASGARASSPTT